MSEDAVSGHAFISYVREDTEAADRLQQALQAAGILVWRDTADLWPGQDWRTRIRRAIIDDALVFIACFSRKSVSKETSYQNEELTLAVEQLRLRPPGDSWLLPVRLDDCEIPDREIGGGRTLASIQYLDLFGDRQAEVLMARLVGTVMRKLSQSGSRSSASGRPIDPADQWNLDSPSVPAGKDGWPDPAVDMVLKSGLAVPPGLARVGQPLSDAAIRSLCTSLDRSPLTECLFKLTRLMSAGLYNFQRRGHPNSSGTATLTWEIAQGEISPFQVRVEVEAPGQYGRPDTRALIISVTTISRFSAWLQSGTAPEFPPPGLRRRLEITEWESLLGAMIATLMEPHVAAAIADLAGVDPIQVPPPRIVHLVSDHEIAALFPAWLQPITGVTGTRESHLLADPSLNLVLDDERASQVSRWLRQIAQDAGLVGMDRLAMQVSHDLR